MSPQSIRALFLSLLGVFVLGIGSVGSALASPTSPQTFDGVGGRFGGRTLIGGGGANRNILLKPEDAGIPIHVPLEMVGPVQFEDVPVIHAVISEPEGFARKRFGPAVLGEDGSLSLRLPPEAVAGTLKLNRGDFRFVETADFRVEEGAVRFAAPLQIEPGCRVTVHVRQDGEVSTGAVKGFFLFSRGTPGLKPSRKGRWTRAKEGKIALGPIVPSDQGWIVIKCRGYGTERIRLDEEFVQWRGDVELHVDLKPEYKLKVKAERLQGRSLDGAKIHVNNQPWGLKYGLTVGRLDRDRFYSLNGLGSGAYFGSVLGEGLLPALETIQLDGDPGDTVEWTLKVNPGLGVRGQVVSAAGSPLAGAEIQLRPVVGGRALEPMPDEFAWSGVGRNPDSQEKGTADDQGLFFLSGFQRAKSFTLLVQVPPAPETIPAGLKRMQTRRYVRDHSVWTNVHGVGTDFERTEVVMGQNKEGIRGRVLDGQGAALSGFKVRAYADCDGDALVEQLEQGRSSFHGLGQVFYATNGVGGGEFHFPRLQGGSWVLLATKTGYVSQIIRSAEPGPGRIPITMPQSGSVVGTIQASDGRIVEESEFHLIDGEGRERSYPADASFHARNVIPGTYTAWAHVPDVGRSAAVSVQVSPGEKCEVGPMTLLENGSVAGLVDPSIRDRNLKILLSAAKANPGAPQVERSGKNVMLSPQGAFSMKDVLPGTYHVEDVFVDGEGEPLRFGTGYREQVVVRAGQRSEARHGPTGQDSKVSGAISLGGAPMPAGWIAFQDVASDQRFHAQVDELGRYQAWVPAHATYRVYAAVERDPHESLNWIWLSEGWTAQEASVQKEWVEGGGSVKVEWIDGEGAMIQWVQVPFAAEAVWYPEGPGEEFSSTGVVPQGGGITHLVPGASYRIRLQGNSYFGDLLQARDVLFQVPADGSVPTVRIHCVPFAQD